MKTLFLEQQGGRIAYDDNGQGPLVVCVPGMGDLRGEYRFLAPKLTAAGYRVACMDVRGHGESSTGWDGFSVAEIGSDILALIRSLDAGPAVVIGESMAGGAAVWAAAEAPHLVRGLALMGAFVRGGPNWLTGGLYRLMFSRPWGPAMWKTYYSSLYPTHKPADFADYTATLQANLQESGRMEALAQMLLASKAASEARLAQVKAPAIVFMGSKDPDFKNPEVEAQWLAEGLKAPYHMIPGAGHYPHVEMLETVLPLVLAFLAKVTNAA